MNREKSKDVSKPPFTSYWIIFAFISLLPLFAFSQSKNELQKKKKELEKDIQYTNILLKETKKNKEASLNQLTTLKKQITYRQRLINTITKEVKLIDRQIAENNDIVRSLEQDLLQIKNDYAKMIYYGYKNRSSYTKLMFVFASNDFNQALKRLKYLQEYSEYRHEQADLIVKTKELINEKNQDLEEKRKTKRSLMESKEKERMELSTKKKEKNNVYESLKAKENQLREDLKKQQKEAAKLQKAIEDIIAEEIQKARDLAKTKSGFALTPEEAKLSANFKNNKGKLPWPVKRGIIASSFGEHNHPVLSGIKIYNNGIDLSTNKGAIARSIFDGIVTGVIILPGSNKKAVIVRHGEYFSVYGNLQQVFVKKGDKVGLKQDIGVVYTDAIKFKTESHLEIWKLSGGGTVKLNPQKWIVQKGKSE
ncbi:MAG TPA: peptidase M23 [Flavobacteriales bacterium]|nr:peptidase M23 [Flavobacteriales bacterium]